MRWGIRSDSRGWWSGPCGIFELRRRYRCWVVLMAFSGIRGGERRSGRRSLAASDTILARGLLCSACGPSVALHRTSACLRTSDLNWRDQRPNSKGELSLHSRLGKDDLLRRHRARCGHRRWCHELRLCSLLTFNRSTSGCRMTPAAQSRPTRALRANDKSPLNLTFTDSV